jgi:hypothetical protein
LSFRLVAFLTAARSDLPLLRVILIGTRSLLCAERWWPQRSELKVLIGQPLHAAGHDWQAALQLQNAARRQILALLNEPDAAA